MDKKEKMNNVKRIFDKYRIKRTNYEDEFFMDLIDTIENYSSTQSKVIEHEEPKKKTNNKPMLGEKMELMINIEGICNELKGLTKHNRYSFSLDVRRFPRTVFLSETKLLIRDRDFQKSDIIVFYDDTLLRTGNRGFLVTRDEIVSNINGLFKVFRFQEMTNPPEYIIGHKKDAFRIHIDDLNIDIKVQKNIQYSAVVLDILNLLYQYSRIIIEEHKNRRR